MRKPYIPVILGGMVLLAAAWFVAAPHLTLRGLQAAARSGDPEQIDKYVDFPTVRENLKADLKAAFLKQMESEADNPFAGLGLMLGNAMVDNLVDSFVSSSGMAAIARGHKPSVDERGRVEAPRDTKDFVVDRRGLNEFAVQFKDAESQSPTLIFRREGLRWELKRLDLGDLSDTRDSGN